MVSEKSYRRNGFTIQIDTSTPKLLAKIRRLDADFLRLV